MILTIYSNTYCIMAGTNITAQTGTNIMILTFRPERFLPGTNIMRHPLFLKFLDPPLGMTAQNPNKACLEALLQFSPERVYIHLCGNDINIATNPKEIAENLLDLVRYI